MCLTSGFYRRKPLLAGENFIAPFHSQAGEVYLS